jgi:NADPH:quinone reductase-like Zn-dependent oxidoreductase
MLAAVAARIDSDDPLAALELREVAEPDPPEGWEIVEVRAAALNRHDWWTLRGVGVTDECLPLVLGCDAAGVAADGREVVVHAVLSTAAPGEDETLVQDLRLLSERGVAGDAVAPPGGPVAEPGAETTVAPVQRGRVPPGRVPHGVPDDVHPSRAAGRCWCRAPAAASPPRRSCSASQPASRCTRRVGSEAKRERALALGAAAAVEPGGRLPERVDAVVETVGKATWDHSLKSLRPGGVVVVSGATTGSDPPADLSRLFWRQLSVIGSSMGTRDELAAPCARLQETGARPVIDSEWPLERAPEAFDRLLSDDLFGKVVVIP